MKKTKRLERITDKMFEELPASLVSYVRGGLIDDGGGGAGTFGTIRPVFTGLDGTVDPKGDEPDAS